MEIKDPAIAALEKQLPFLPGTRFDISKVGDLATSISLSPLDAAINKVHYPSFCFLCSWVLSTCIPFSGASFLHCNRTRSVAAGKKIKRMDSTTHLYSFLVSVCIYIDHDNDTSFLVVLGPFTFPQIPCLRLLQRRRYFSRRATWNR